MKIIDLKIGVVGLLIAFLMGAIVGGVLMLKIGLDLSMGRPADPEVVIGEGSLHIWDTGDAKFDPAGDAYFLSRDGKQMIRAVDTGENTPVFVAFDISK